MITVECIDELADFVGKKAEVAAITERAMNGELNFEAALTERVALLKGLPEAVLQQCYNDRVKMMGGAKALVQTMRENGAHCILVSGGFTYFTDRIRERLGIDFARSNVLEVESGPGLIAPTGSGGTLTGRMVDQPWGDICDGAEKRRTLLEVATLMGIAPAQCIAMGDGANDLPMMGVAGLSVAYHAKPAVREKAHVAINSGGLDRLLEVLQA